jgi:hypothetical protein
MQGHGALPHHLCLSPVFSSNTRLWHSSHPPHTTHMRRISMQLKGWGYSIERVTAGSLKDLEKGPSEICSNQGRLSRGDAASPGPGWMAPVWHWEDWPRWSRNRVGRESEGHSGQQRHLPWGRNQEGDRGNVQQSTPAHQGLVPLIAELSLPGKLASSLAGLTTMEWRHEGEKHLGSRSPLRWEAWRGSFILSSVLSIRCNLPLPYTHFELKPTCSHSTF